MNRILLLRNKDFFNKNNIISISDNSYKIPEKNSLLFIGSHTKSIDTFDHIPKIFKEISEQKDYEYIIILGKTDCLFGKDGIEIPKNIKMIFANNINFNHPKIKFLPMGSDFRSIESFQYGNFSNKERNILCYCNFSLNTHNDREKIFDKVKNKSFIKIENMGKWGTYSISRDEYFKRLSYSKFVICPRGKGLDSFRFYDTIYSGAIPIVIEEPIHNTPFF